MEKTKEFDSKLCDLKKKIIEGACAAVESKGIHQVDTEEMGAVTDMIKDLAEAEEKCWKACYYKSIVEAMEKESDMMEDMDFDGEGGNSRRGYDHWRYASGRFAPAGRGHYSAGYRPMMPETVDPYMGGQDWDSMGYSSSSGGGQNGSSSMGNSGTSGGESRMGYPTSMRGQRFDKYNRARMGYHESRDAKSKEHMDESAKEYLVDTVESIREVWKDADPAMRKEIKNKFAALMSEMG